MFHPFDRAKPRLSRRDREARLRVNLEQALAFRPGSREVHGQVGWKPRPVGGELHFNIVKKRF